MWIVMTASAQMPASCHGRYRKIALVELTEDGTDDFVKGWHPPRIDSRIKGIARIEQLGPYHVGTTDRGAYQRALAEAQSLIRKRNGGGYL
jgi:hypothetical protein